MKPTNAIWLIAGIAFVLTAATSVATTASPIVAVLMLVTFGTILVSWKRLTHTIMQWVEKRLIASQPNAHQRGYILQRLYQLPYENDAFSTRDPSEDKTFTVRHYLDERLTMTFVIEFVENEYIGPASIGNEYRRTKRSYRLSPKRSTIHYEESVGLRYDGSVEYHKRETMRQELDHLPDEVIECVEYALLNWERVSAL